LPKVKIENILAALTSRDHALLELGTIKGDYVLAVSFALKSNGLVKIVANNLVVDEVVYGLLNEAVVSPGHIDHVRKKFSPKLSKLNLADLIFEPFTRFREVLKDKHILLETLFFEKLGHVFGSLSCVDDQEAKTLSQADLDSCLVLLVDRFNKLIELPKVSSLSLLKLVEDVHKLGVLASYLLFVFNLLEFKFLLKKHALKSLHLLHYF